MSNAAGNVNIVLSVNQANFSQAMTNAQRELDKFAGKAKDAGHGTVSGMQAASASIRLLENPLGNNMRAIERLISQSKVLSGVMKAAFPLVGAIAIGSMFAKLGGEVVELVKKLQAMPKAINQGFAELAQGQKTATDELIVSTDKLQNHVDKLLKRPENTLKLEFDEARLAADRLAGSIASANSRLNDLLSKNHLSNWSMLLGYASTNNREGTTKAFSAQADSNAYDLANAAPGSADEARAKKALQDTQNAQLAEARQDLAKRQAAAGKHKGYGHAADIVLGDGAGDGSADATNINIDKGIITTILNAQKQQAAEVLNTQTQGEDARVQAAHDAAEAHKQAAAQAAAAQRQADEKRIRSMQDGLDQEKLLGNVTIAGVYQYWAARIGAFTQGSAAYNEVLGKQTAAAVEAAGKAHELIQHQKELNKREDSTDELSGSSIVARSNEFFQRQNVKTVGEFNQDGIDKSQLAITNAANDAKEKEAALNEESGRTLSKYAVAAQLAAVHTKEYTAQLTALQTILDIKQTEVDADPSKENKKALEAAQVALSDAQSKRVIQVQQDSDNTNPASSLASVGFEDAMRDFVASTRDAAGQMKELTTNTLDSLNAELVKGISGQKTDFKGAGANIFRNVAATGIKKAEGMLFGGGAGDGSQSKPLYVKLVGGLGKMGGGLKDLFGGGSDGSGSSSKTGGFFSSLIGLLPHFAAGGPISSNMLSVVGENGPELFSPGTSGSIVPNHKIVSGDSGMGGNHAYYNVSVANGVTPEQMNMHMNAALKQFHPVVVQSSVQAMKGNQNRTPMSKR